MNKKQAIKLLESYGIECFKITNNLYGYCNNFGRLNTIIIEGFRVLNHHKFNKLGFGLVFK